MALHLELIPTNQDDKKFLKILFAKVKGQEIEGTSEVDDKVLSMTQLKVEMLVKVRFLYPNLLMRIKMHVFHSIYNKT